MANKTVVNGDSGDCNLEAKTAVLKFGGTSVGKFAPEIAQICLLLRAARDAARNPPADYRSITTKLREEHIQAGGCITSPEIRQHFNIHIDALFDELSQVLDSAPKSAVVDPAYGDRVISVGEKLSASLLTALLEDRGIPSQYIDLSDAINFLVPDRLSPEFYQNLSSCFRKRLLTSEGHVPVITGFFGKIPGGLVNRLGRGYSDLCAALVAVALQATELQVWKEVDGVFTADPRKVPTARLLPTLTPSEAGELTFYGSEVIHNLTLEQLGRPRIPIRIKNVLRPHGAGTIIQPDDLGDSSSRENQYAAPKPLRPKRPTAVTVKEQITVLNIHSNRKLDSPDFLAKICTIASSHGLAIDLIEKGECTVSLALHNSRPVSSPPWSSPPTSTSNNNSNNNSNHGGGGDIVDTAINPGSRSREITSRYRIQDENLRVAVRELEEYGRVDVVHGMAILSLIGMGLKRSVGIAYKFLGALASNNINVEMLSQGGSEISIAAVIEQREALRALSVVHSELFTYD
ncbi:hypothetical protein Q9189_004196 [Teloschistes chrysophthalmus]